jgi:hypothetical protein
MPQQKIADRMGIPRQTITRYLLNLHSSAFWANAYEEFDGPSDTPDEESSTGKY